MGDKLEAKMGVEFKDIKKTTLRGIVGQKIKNVYLELHDDSFCSDIPVVIIELDNGNHIYAQSDDEFNDSGIMVAIKNDKPVYLNYEGYK